MMTSTRRMMDVINTSCHVSFNQHTNFVHFNSTCIDDEDQIFAVDVVNWFFTVVIMLIGVLSVLSNGFVLVILADNLQKGQNSVLISLACCDLMAGLNILSGKLQLFWYDNIHSGIPCVLTACLYLLAYGGQSCTLLLLTVDRWIAIKYPLKCRMILNKRKINKLIIAIWMYHLVLAGYSIYDNTWTVGSGCIPLIVFRYEAILPCVVLTVIALFAIMILYYRIHRITSRPSLAASDPSKILDDQMFNQERKSVLVVGTILGLFYGSWAAALATEAIKRIPTNSFVSALLQFVIEQLLHTLFVSSSALNTVVYHYRCQAFRDAVNKRLWPERHREQRRTQTMTDLGFTARH